MWRSYVAGGRDRRESRGLWQEFIYNLILPDYDEALRPDSVVHYAERRHLIFLIRHTWGAFLVLLARRRRAVLRRGLGGHPQRAWPPPRASLYILWTAVHWAVVVLYVTERRLLEVGGFFSMSIALLPLTKLTDLKFEQGFLGPAVHLRQRSAWRRPARSRPCRRSPTSACRCSSTSEISQPPGTPADPGDD